MLKLKSSVGPLFISALLLSSCSIINKRAETPPIEALRYIERGEYNKGLALLSSSCRQSHDNQLPDECRAEFEQIRRIADQGYERKDFVKAGRVYQALIRNNITGDAPPGTFSFDTDYLKKKLRECSKALTEIGLVRYREEKLDEAISIWEKVLSFDPDNKSLKKAVDIASRQRQQLKNIN
jgi:tetratricopeptide (TPR) repeat protein